MGGTANYCPGPYTLYVSEDNGETFERHSKLPFDDEIYYVTASTRRHAVIKSRSQETKHHFGKDLENSELENKYHAHKQAVD